MALRALLNNWITFISGPLLLAITPGKLMTIFMKNHHRYSTFPLCGWALLLLLFTGCSLAWACADNFRPSTPSTSSHSPVSITNFGPALKKFLAQASGKPFKEQLRIWDEVIEKDHQNYFAKLVWEKDANPNWQDDKELTLKYYFQQILGEFGKDVLRELESFDPKVQANIQKFLTFFPDAKLPQNIYAGPALTFTGKAAHAGDVMGFGIDLITKLNLDINVIFAHEIFHIHHHRAAQIDKYFPQSMNELPLAFLWKEGLATYVSQVLNEEAPLAEILTSEDLAKVSEEGLYWLASKFLADISWPLNDFDKITDKWFSAYQTPAQQAQQDGFPVRSGYLLGYRVMQMIAYYTEYSMAELAHLNYFQIRNELIRVLTTLAQQYPHREKPKNFYTEPQK